MTVVTYRIPNINCGHCVHTVTTELQDLEGVLSVQADVQTKIARIEYKVPATEEKIVELLEEINYPPEK